MKATAHERFPHLAAATLLAASAAAAVGLDVASSRHAFMLLAFAPVVEEAVFRAGLQESLLRRGLRPAAANIATALAFGAMHALFRSAWLGLAVLPASLLLGAVYLRWRRLWPCILLHAALNFAWLGAHAWTAPFATPWS